MIINTTDINTRTNEGRLALALLAVVTTQSHQSKTPDDVIASVHPLITKMFEGEPETTDGLPADLAIIKTCKLVDELKRRTAVVTTIYLGPYDETKVEGPAAVLVIVD